MIHILACNEGGNLKCVGKMKFIDLVGYENTGRNSMDGTNFIEGTQINKSLNTLLNVIHAINANETRFPYRESKLARVLQDSLGGNNHISMIVCLNPFFCPDTIHAINLASRLKIIKLVSVLSSSRKKHSNSRAPLSANKSNSGVAVFSTTKKQTNSRLPFSAKKTNVMLKGRNFFDGTEEANGIKEQVLSTENNPSDVVKSDLSNGGSNFVPFMKEEKCIGGALFSSDVKDIPSTILASSQEEVPASDAKQEIVSLELKTKDVSVKTESNFTDFLHHVNGDNIDKENNHLRVNESQTPLLTARLIELRENLMCFATPLSVSRPHDPEPKIPVITQKLELSNCQSETFSKQNSRMKGIREKRASYILELWEDSPEPFKSLDDLQEIGLSAKQGIEMLSLGSFTTGAILLAGLFFYDIFWVFFTPVMVSVAKSFDAPIKLLFPTRVAARPFSMLGLGDIVIPGIFVALALRFDVSRGRNRQYFKSAFLGYAVGVVLTIVVMNWFQAAQEAIHSMSDSYNTQLYTQCQSPTNAFIARCSLKPAILYKISTLQHL